MDIIPVWLAPSASDSAIHYWYQLWGQMAPRRLCDGDIGFLQWSEDGEQVCAPCRDVYATDQRRGRAAFMPFAPEECGLNCEELQNLCNTAMFPIQTSNIELEETHMVADTTIRAFGLFYEFCKSLPSPSSKAIEQKALDMKAKSESGGYFWGSLKGFLVRNGWDYQKVKEGKARFIEKLEPKYKSSYEVTLDSYIACCERERIVNTLPFRSNKRRVALAGLDIQVDPEVVLTNEDGQELLLKVCLPSSVPGREAIQAMCLLMEHLQDEYEAAVWPIHRERWMRPNRLGSEMRADIESRARWLLEFWLEHGLIKPRTISLFDQLN